MARFIKRFKTFSEYDEFKNSSNYRTPNVCKIMENSSIIYNKLKSIDYNGHEYVDLGLPSGLKWAKYNVGANSESDAGLFFAWGETQGYTADDVRNGVHGFYPDEYKWGTQSNLFKYNDTDNNSVLDLTDDSARVNMGGDWVMPTKENFEELLEYTTCEESTINDVYGITFTSIINGNTLFFPCGYCTYGGVLTDVIVASSSLYNENKLHSCNLSNFGNKPLITHIDRNIGFTVRGVIF